MGQSMELTAAFLHFADHLPPVQIHIYDIMIATDDLNHDGDLPITGQHFISRHHGFACKESPAWRIKSPLAEKVMDDKIERPWDFFYP